MWISTHVKIEGYSDHREQPEDLVEPSEVPMEPLLLRLRQWEEKPVEEVDRHQRDGIQHERLEHIRADLGVAGYPAKAIRSNASKQQCFERQTSRRVSRLCPI